MREHLGRQAGVAKVEVKLLDGTVTVTPREDGKVDPASILKATYDSGVKVAEMTITATGRLELDPAQGLLFHVTPNLAFPIAPGAKADDLRGMAGTGTQVTLRGQLYKKPTGKQKPKETEPLRLEVLEVLRKE